MGEDLSTKNYAAVKPAKTADDLIIRAVSKLDKIALGVSVGVCLGLIIFAATILLLVKESRAIPYAELLGQYFIGYRVTVKGSFCGLAYGFVFGFALGWFIAFLRNLLITIYLYIVRLKADLASINKLIDY